MNLRKRISKRLDAVNLRQSELAVRLKLPNAQSISNWCARESVPTKHLFDVCDLLECRPKWLITGEGQEEAGTKRSPIDADALYKIVSETQAALTGVGFECSAKRFTLLVVESYFLWTETGRMPDFEQLVRLVEIQSNILKRVA